MNFLQSLTAPIWGNHYKASLCECDYCQRSIVLKNPAAKKAGIQMHGRWFCSSQCFTAAAEREISARLRTGYYRTDPTPRMPLGLTMVRRAMLTDDQYKQAVRIQKKSGQDIEELLIQEGFVSEEQLTAARAAQWNCPVFDVPGYPAPNEVRIPQALIDAHGAAPLHYVASSKTLLIGFVRVVEYGFLYAVETITGCKTQACFITPSYFQQKTEQRKSEQGKLLLDCNEFGDFGRNQEMKVTAVMSPLEMARVLCKQSVEFEADDVSLTSCKNFVWARLKNSGKEFDLLFATSQHAS